MKLLSFKVDGRERFGLLSGGGVVDLTKRTKFEDLRAALGELDKLQSHAGETPDYGLEDIRFLPVIPNPSRILCAGLNYLSHITETRLPRPPRPIIFTRFASSQVGHFDSLVRPRLSEKFDFEGELAVIIRKPCRYVSREDAFDVIAGYSCYNDGSIRDWQLHSSQWIPGKNFPASGAFGPCLVTRDEVGDITRSSLVTRLNGEEVQRALINDLMFDIPSLVAYCSSFTMLDAGDVIVTGTTGGVGESRRPQLWMKPGDLIEVEIDGVGRLSNQVIAEP
ncbi:5-carboxymethyl-2-hydroxymuconate isomerase [Bradyrhizobium sp. CCBAU 11386]|uniref:fumarylacetoacetate hydrolase family protein n=1 Tax=Bradyrhizobium sp. CCBAU 11386 TaxID=1630837 RepID=UPI0023029F5A|nr:fumarylacetoacetate hydrolase family protein [Bradyrhizobium sp. CCBAU 11386]MDA9504424.1 5-carboxymethyl-2-hydroxymuconate isomerase [Bradyrhizobium sp. CCBAU 11386]